MKRLVTKLVGVVALVGALVFNSGCTRIGPGYVGVKISNAGTTRGVADIPTTTGWVVYMPGMTSVFEYPTFMQTATWQGDERFTFNAEGMTIGADANISYSILADKVPAFYVKFRNDDLEQFTHGYLRNITRDALNDISPQYKVDELYGVKKEEFIQKVKDRVAAKVADIGVVIDQFGFVGALDLPPNVIASLNAKVTATQDAIRVENELRIATAEAQKAVATAEGAARVQIAAAEGQVKVAEQQAKANAIITGSVNDRLLEWERLKIQYQMLSKWDGALPVYSGGTTPLVQLPSVK